MASSCSANAVQLHNEARVLAAAARRRLRLGRMANVVTAAALLFVASFTIYELVELRQLYDQYQEAQWQAAHINDALRPHGDNSPAGVGLFGFGPILLPVVAAVRSLWIYMRAIGIALAGLLAFYFAPAIVSLPFAVAASTLWRRPHVIVMLRPFQHEQTTRALKRLTRRALSGFGFCYTLGDRDL